jgi:hypothetical protein
MNALRSKLIVTGLIATAVHLSNRQQRGLVCEDTLVTSDSGRQGDTCLLVFRFFSKFILLIHLKSAADRLNYSGSIASDFETNETRIVQQQLFGCSRIGEQMTVESRKVSEVSGSEMLTLPT